MQVDLRKSEEVFRREWGAEIQRDCRIIGKSLREW